MSFIKAKVEIQGETLVVDDLPDEPGLRDLPRPDARLHLAPADPSGAGGGGDLRRRARVPGAPAVRRPPPDPSRLPAGRAAPA